MTHLGQDLEQVFQYALHAHGGQRRKGTDIPYASHLMSTAALVLEAGGDEDQAIAALLHDAAEDAGGRERLDDIRLHFGDRVADIVDACTDTYEDPKPDWRERKEKYLDHLETADPDALLVSCADKLHNARSILADYREIGDELWERFNQESGGADGQLWYYRGLVDVFERRLGNALARELGRTVNELAELVSRSTTLGGG
jgi:(p)ppGpp synthase/HD superfamily hydrolase